MFKQVWLDRIAEWQIVERLQLNVSSGNDEPLFTKDEVLLL